MITIVIVYNINDDVRDDNANVGHIDRESERGVYDSKRSNGGVAL